MRIAFSKRLWKLCVRTPSQLEVSFIKNLNVFYISEHVKASFGVELTGIAGLDDSVKAMKLFKWSGASMSKLLRVRSVQAGYPDKLLSFHSLRAGFLSSAYMNSGTDSSKHVALERIMQPMGGWSQHGTSMQGYFTIAAMATYVANYCVTGEGHMVSRLLMEPENLHRIKFLPISWKDDTNFKPFHEKMNSKFSKPALTAAQLSSLRRKCWRAAYRALVLSTAVLKAEASSTFCQYEGKTRSALKWSLYQKLGRAYVVNELKNDFSKMDHYVALFLKFAEPILLDPTLPTPKARTHTAKKDTVSRAKNPETGHRLRLPWGKDEDAVLVKGKRLKMKWVQICEGLLDRTNEDCRLRWRVIEHLHRDILDAPIAAVPEVSAPIATLPVTDLPHAPLPVAVVASIDPSSLSSPSIAVPVSSADDDEVMAEEFFDFDDALFEGNVPDVHFMEDDDSEEVSAYDSDDDFYDSDDDNDSSSDYSD